MALLKTYTSVSNVFQIFDNYIAADIKTAADWQNSALSYAKIRLVGVRAEYIMPNTSG